MNKCKTCKHWNKYDPKKNYDEVVYPTYHPTTFEPLTEDDRKRLYPYNVNFCNAPKILFFERPEKDAAVLLDGSEYMAQLATAEDFGCTLHEPKSKDISTTNYGG